MNTTYRPIVAKDEFVGHTFEEIRVIQGLRHSVQEFAQILRGEKKGNNAMEFIDEMILEAEELRKNESR